MISQTPIHSFREMGIDEAMAKVIHWSEPPKYNIEETHSHDFYELLIYRKGGGFHTINYQKEKIRDCSIHIVAKSSTHLSERSRKSEGFTIAFSDMYLSQLQQFDSSIDYKEFYSQPGFIHFNKTEFEELDVLLRELIKNENNRSYFLNLLASVLCKIILLKKDTMLTQKTDESISAFREYLSHHYLEKTVVDDFLEKENHSKIAFSRKLKKLTGLTPLQMLHQKLHLEAKKLLYNTHDSIKEIAWQLNFEDESYFCKFFKSQEDLSPNEFRKKYK